MRSCHRAAGVFPLKMEFWSSKRFFSYLSEHRNKIWSIRANRFFRQILPKILCLFKHSQSWTYNDILLLTDIKQPLSPTDVLLCAHLDIWVTGAFYFGWSGCTQTDDNMDQSDWIRSPRRFFQTATIAGHGHLSHLKRDAILSSTCFSRWRVLPPLLEMSEGINDEQMAAYSMTMPNMRSSTRDYHCHNTENARKLADITVQIYAGKYQICMSECNTEHRENTVELPELWTKIILDTKPVTESLCLSKLARAARVIRYALWTERSAASSRTISSSQASNFKYRKRFHAGIVENILSWRCKWKDMIINCKCKFLCQSDRIVPFLEICKIPGQMKYLRGLFYLK